MNPDFLKVLCCPRTGDDLRLEVDQTFTDGSVETGTLIAAQSGNRYAIIRGIPAIHR